MTERERWIVYPLLFLALGAAFRDKLVDRTTTKVIKCQELDIEDESGRTLAKIGRTDATPTAPSIGYFLLNGQLDVNGLLKVDGVVNAKQYAYQGLVLPLWQPIPGFIMPNVVHPTQPQAPSKPPANESKQGQDAAKPPKPAADSPPPPK
jgi:hypothetical protein